MGLEVVLGALVLLGPLSHVPSLVRLIRLKTGDGMTVTLCGIGFLSYGGWLVLVAPLGVYMLGVVLCSALLEVASMWYVRKWGAAPWRHVFGWLAAAALVGLLAAYVPGAAFPFVLLVDLSWYVRALRDILFSKAARAVSVWGWVCSLSANGAWAVSAFNERAWWLLLQCVPLTIAAICALCATLYAHRRDLPVQ